MSTPLAAANAYASMGGLGDIKAAKPAALSEIGGEEGLQAPKFAEMVEGSLGGFIQQGQNMESSVLQSSVGKTNIVDVVTAVSETEMQLNTLVALRDKVIDAYEKIMNMPV